MKYLKLLVVILLVSVLSFPCFAEVPKLIEYIGNLEKPNGSPYPQGTYDISFQICTDIDCTNSLWSETHTVEISSKNKKDIDGGTSYEAAYKVVLGIINSLDSLAFDQDYYLRTSEATQGYSNTEQIMSTPYSLRSDFANYAETVYDSETGQYTTLQNITINEAKNADTVDEFHANAIPTANTLLPLDGFGQFPDSVIPDNITINYAAHASSADFATDAAYAASAGNADMVDSKHASDFALAGHSHPNPPNQLIENGRYIYTCGFRNWNNTTDWHTWILWPYNNGMSSCNSVVCSVRPGGGQWKSWTYEKSDLITGEVIQLGGDNCF
jgi:hypothetical protein